MQRNLTAYVPVRGFVNGALLWLALLVAVVAAPARAEPLTLLVLGDSLTAGLGLPAEQAFPAQLEAALTQQGVAVQVVNGGVSGDTSAGGLRRVDWLLAGSSPDLVIIELGANDGLRGIDPAVTEANLDALIRRIRQRNIAVLLAGMLAPPNLGRAYGAAFESLYSRLAERHGVPLYGFFLDGVAARRELNQNDGIHPNAAGVAVIVERMLPLVQQSLESLPTDTPLK